MSRLQRHATRSPLAFLPGSSSPSSARPPSPNPVVRTADPIKRGLKLSDFPRTIKVADNVYTYEDFHAGAEKFTTTNMFVVTDDGVLVADGQGSAGRDQRPRRRDREGHAAADQVRRRSAPTTATTRPATRRSPPASPTSSIRRRRRSSSARRTAGSRRGDARCWCRSDKHSIKLGGEDDRHPVPRPRAYRAAT